MKKSNAKAILIGSTALKISGKGDIDFGVYTSENNWDNVLKVLINYFKKAESLNNKGFARFNTSYKKHDIKVVLRKGKSALRDKRLLKYLKLHPKLLNEYEKIKNKYSFSAREYAIQKNKFLRKTILKIPE